MQSFVLFYSVSHRFYSCVMRLWRGSVSIKTSTGMFSSVPVSFCFLLQTAHRPFAWSVLLFDQALSRLWVFMPVCFNLWCSLWTVCLAGLSCLLSNANAKRAEVWCLVMSAQCEFCLGVPSKVRSGLDSSVLFCLGCSRAAGANSLAADSTAATSGLKGMFDHYNCLLFGRSFLLKLSVHCLTIASGSESEQTDT